MAKITTGDQAKLIDHITRGTKHVRNLGIIMSLACLTAEELICMFHEYSEIFGDDNALTEAMSEYSHWGKNAKHN